MGKSIYESMHSGDDTKRREEVVEHNILPNVTYNNLAEVMHDVEGGDESPAIEIVGVLREVGNNIDTLEIQLTELYKQGKVSGDVIAVLNRLRDNFGFGISKIIDDAREAKK